MNSIEVSAKTLDEAKTEALIRLGAPSDRVKIEVLEEGTKGLLGLFGKDAKIRATLLEEDEMPAEKPAKAEGQTKDKGGKKVKANADAPAAAEKTSEKTAEKTDAKAEKNTKAGKGEKPAKAAKSDANKAAKAEKGAEKAAAEKAEPAKVELPPIEPKEFVTATGEKVTVDDSLEKRIREANARAEKSGASRKEGGKRDGKRRDDRRESAPKAEPVAPVCYPIPADAEEVQEQLKKFLAEVLGAMGINAVMTTSFSDEGILEVDIESADPVEEGADSGMGVIIGKRGNTLDSLQYLATLVINKGRNDHLHIKLDTEGYRKRRQETLENLAMNTARKVRKSGRRIMLDPMNPYERRIIHSALQNERGIETYSEGEEPYRKVIIAPTRNYK